MNLCCFSQVLGRQPIGFLILFWNPSSHFDDFAETLNPLEANNTRTIWIRFSCVVCSCHKEIADYFPRSWVFVWEEEMDDRAEEEDTPRSWLVRPCWQTNKKGKSILEKKQSEIFRRDNFNLNCSWCDNCACAEAVCPCEAQHDAGESFFFFFSRKLFCLSNRVNAPWAHLTPGGSPKEKKRK